MGRRALIAVAALAVAAGLFFVLRPGDDSSGPGTGTAPSPPAPPTTTGVLQPPPPPPAPPSPPPPARVVIAVRDGVPVGGIRNVTVAKGRRVVLIVSADVTDNVHLHGYDIARDVAPGKPARLSFRATIVGTVEAELEDRGLPIARVTAQP